MPAPHRAEQEPAPTEAVAANADSQTADTQFTEVQQEEPVADMGPEAPDMTPVREQTPVAISTLTRTKYVAPKYPRAAERRNLSGWVDVVFTVDIDGSTKDIEIMGSEPGEVFVNSATRAVERWEFMPVEENGQIVEKRAGVRMMFAIE